MDYNSLDVSSIAREPGILVATLVSLGVSTLGLFHPARSRTRIPAWSLVPFIGAYVAAIINWALVLSALYDGLRPESPDDAFAALSAAKLLSSSHIIPNLVIGLTRLFLLTCLLRFIGDGSRWLRKFISTLIVLCMLWTTIACIISTAGCHITQSSQLVMGAGCTNPHARIASLAALDTFLLASCSAVPIVVWKRRRHHVSRRVVICFCALPILSSVLYIVQAALSLRALTSKSSEYTAASLIVKQATVAYVLLNACAASTISLQNTPPPTPLNEDARRVSMNGEIEDHEKGLLRPTISIGNASLEAEEMRQDFRVERRPSDLCISNFSSINLPQPAELWVATMATDGAPTDDINAHSAESDSTGKLKELTQEQSPSSSRLNGGSRPPSSLSCTRLSPPKASYITSKPPSASPNWTSFDRYVIRAAQSPVSPTKSATPDSPSRSAFLIAPTAVLRSPTAPSPQVPLASSPNTLSVPAQSRHGSLASQRKPSIAPQGSSLVDSKRNSGAFSSRHGSVTSNMRTGSIFSRTGSVASRSRQGSFFSSHDSVGSSMRRPSYLRHGSVTSNPVSMSDFRSRASSITSSFPRRTSFVRGASFSTAAGSAQSPCISTPGTVPEDFPPDGKDYFATAYPNLSVDEIVPSFLRASSIGSATPNSMHSAFGMPLDSPRSGTWTPLRQHRRRKRTISDLSGAASALTFHACAPDPITTSGRARSKTTSGVSIAIAAGTLLAELPELPQPAVAEPVKKEGASPVNAGIKVPDTLAMEDFVARSVSVVPEAEEPDSPGQRGEVRLESIEDTEGGPESSTGADGGRSGELVAGD